MTDKRQRDKWILAAQWQSPPRAPGVPRALLADPNKTAVGRPMFDFEAPNGIRTADIYLVRDKRLVAE